MDIAVLAGGLSAERDVSFQTGDMVARALRDNGHRVILLDVFMGYGTEPEDVSDIFAHSRAASMAIPDISETAPDLAKIKAARKDTSDCFFRSECHFHMPIGGHCFSGAPRGRRRERKDSGGVRSVWDPVYRKRLLKQRPGDG